jgi:hypothetical protein
MKTISDINAELDALEVRIDALAEQLEQERDHPDYRKWELELGAQLAKWNDILLELRRRN